MKIYNILVRFSIFTTSLSMIIYIKTQKHDDYIVILFLFLINILVFLLPITSKKY
jgi:hypothetical protein